MKQHIAHKLKSIETEKLLPSHDVSLLKSDKGIYDMASHQCIQPDCFKFKTYNVISIFIQHLFQSF